LVIHQSFKSHFTDSSHVKFGRHLPLFLLLVRLITPLRIGASVGLNCMSKPFQAMLHDLLLN
jgi:hypothetical protein